MGCYEQKSPSSVLSPWLIDIDLSDPAVICTSEELGIENPAHTNTMLASPVQSSSLKRAASSATSNSSPEDGGTRKASKRRRKSRAKPKAPVNQLSANKLNFKDIVHQFTGHHDPAPQPAEFCKAPPPCNPPAVDAVDAQVGFSQSQVLLARLAQSLRVLDTICAHFLSQGSMASIDGSPFLQALVSEASTNSTSELGQRRDSHVDIQSKAQELEKFLLRETYQ